MFCNPPPPSLQKKKNKAGRGGGGRAGESLQVLRAAGAGAVGRRKNPGLKERTQARQPCGKGSSRGERVLTCENVGRYLKEVYFDQMLELL